MFKKRKDYPDRKFTLAFVDHSSEKDNVPIELTYNWGKKSQSYEVGDKYGHIAIGVKDFNYISGLEDNDYKVNTELKKMNNSLTVLEFIEDPDGYKIKLIEREYKFENHLRRRIP